jgi:hypothetical protein
LNLLILGKTDNDLSQQITREGGIDPIVDTVASAVDRYGRRNFELIGNDVLAHLAMFPSVNGMLPLYYAAAWRDTSSYPSPRDARLSVVEHLLEVYPGAATVRDGHGRFDVVCRH